VTTQKKSYRRELVVSYGLPVKFASLYQLYAVEVYPEHRQLQCVIRDIHYYDFIKFNVPEFFKLVVA